MWEFQKCYTFEYSSETICKDIRGTEEEDIDEVEETLNDNRYEFRSNSNAISLEKKICFLDLEKTFDRTERDILKVLQSRGVD